MSPVGKGKEKSKQSRTNLTAVSPDPHRYEDEINKRTAAENDFVTLKKVSKRMSRLGGTEGASEAHWIQADGLEYNSEWKQQQPEERMRHVHRWFS